MNQVVLIGRLARDTELSYTTNNQTAKCVFTLAVDRPKRNGEDQGADFLRIVVWGRQAETSDRYLNKGDRCAVIGEIRTGSYKNRDGVTVYTTDIFASRVEFLGNNQFSNNGHNNAQNEKYGESHTSRESTYNSTFDSFDDMPDTFSAAEDDIPF